MRPPHQTWSISFCTVPFVLLKILHLCGVFRKFVWESQPTQHGDTNVKSLQAGLLDQWQTRETCLINSHCFCSPDFCICADVSHLSFNCPDHTHSLNSSFPNYGLSVIFSLSLSCSSCSFFWLHFTSLCFITRHVWPCGSLLSFSSIALS